MNMSKLAQILETSYKAQNCELYIFMKMTTLLVDSGAEYRLNELNY